ncbi:MAG: hypothetical protein IT303_20370 [Dehalococcoidia bacterium]|nr:hypothetical protein [Dehalococcoidia bacterium]
MRAMLFAGLAGLNVLFLSITLEGFAPESPAWSGEHTAWYLSRSAGLVALVCLWVGVAGGLFMSSAWLDGLVGRGRLLAIHQSATLAGLALAATHALVLIPDGWTDFTTVQLFVPFAADYDAGLSGIGTLAFYLSCVVTGTFWIRGLIGPRMWKRIHYAGFVAFYAAWWHGFKLGTDTQEPWVMAIYVVTGLSVLTAVIVRVTYRRPARRVAPVSGVKVA